MIIGWHGNLIDVVLKLINSEGYDDHMWRLMHDTLLDLHMLQLWRHGRGQRSARMRFAWYRPSSTWNPRLSSSTTSMFQVVHNFLKNLLNAKYIWIDGKINLAQRGYLILSFGEFGVQIRCRFRRWPRRSQSWVRAPTVHVWSMGREWAKSSW